MTTQPPGLNPAYTAIRHEIVGLVPRDRTNVLDLGCATGELGRELKRVRNGVRVSGVEIDQQMAEIAAERLDAVVQGDLESWDELVGRLGPTRYDCFVCADVLEHLTDPWALLRGIRAIATPDAVVVASIPNIGHLDTWFNVFVRGTWPYRGRGIHDTSHLRFFARRNIGPLFAQAGYRVERLERAFRIIERPDPRNRFARKLAVPGLRDLLTFQFLAVARLDPAWQPEPPAGDGYGDAIPPR